MWLEVKSVNFDFNSSSTLCLYIVCLLCTVRLLRVVSLIFYRVMVFIVPLRISCFACSLCIAFILIWQFNWYLSRGVKSGCGFLMIHFIVCVCVCEWLCKYAYMCEWKKINSYSFISQWNRTWSHNRIYLFNYYLFFFSFGGKKLTKTATKKTKQRTSPAPKLLCPSKVHFL